MERKEADAERVNRSNRNRLSDTELEPVFSNPESGSVTSLHQTVGNQAVKRLYEKGELQAKLTVNRPDDEFEREAERVAEVVTGIRNPLTNVGSTDIKRKGSTESTAVEGELEQQIQSFRGGGKQLPESTRSYFETQFDHDFSDVKVHTGPQADQAAQSINAKAFTLGNDIVFAEGKYQQKTDPGKQLLAHELTHVVQQGSEVRRQTKPSAKSEVGGQKQSRSRSQGQNKSGTQSTTSKTRREEGEQYVYVASGGGLEPAALEQLERRTRELFERHGFDFNDEWLVRDIEDGNLVLLLRWQASWGEPPSKWMGPDRLASFLQSGSREKSYEIAQSPYESSKQQAKFTEQERQWIREVMKIEEITLLLETLGGKEGLPPVVLHRVKSLGGAAGQTSGKDVAIAKKRPSLQDEDNRINTEKEFKGTLIHELFHFVGNQDLKKPEAAPQRLTVAMMNPTVFGFQEYAFGWFKHPKSGYWLHFDLPRVSKIPYSESYIQNISEKEHPKLISAYENENYEASPMSVSGHSISMNEDLAETMSLYLTSAQTRKKLKSNYPLRYQLMERYFGKLRQIASNSAQKSK